MTNSTHYATGAEACDWVDSLMLPFTPSHPGLNSTLPFQLAEFILLVTQDDLICFKVLSQCYHDPHHLKALFAQLEAEMDTQHLAGYP